MDYPKVGIGIIILNEKGEILVGKRIGKHAPYFSIPGGHLELGETFEEGAAREMLEETGIQIKDLEIIGISNNLETFKTEGYHTVSINLLAKNFVGAPQLLEPEKCKGWFWYAPDELPKPHFEASRAAIDSYLSSKFYSYE